MVCNDRTSENKPFDVHQSISRLHRTFLALFWSSKKRGLLFGKWIEKVIFSSRNWIERKKATRRSLLFLTIDYIVLLKKNINCLEISCDNGIKPFIGLDLKNGKPLGWIVFEKNLLCYYFLFRFHLFLLC